MIIRLRPPSTHRGFTLIEIVVASLMMSLLAVLMAGAWSAFGRPAVDVDSRARLAQEAALAVESLSRDLSGYYPAPDDGRVGPIAASRFLDWATPDGLSLVLTFKPQDNPDGLSYQIVTYQLSGDTLIRWDQAAGTAVPIARYVKSFGAAPDPDGNMAITITMTYRAFTRKYQLVGVHP